MSKALFASLLAVVSSTAAMAEVPHDPALNACGAPDEITSRSLNLIQREALALARNDEILLDPSKVLRKSGANESGSVELFEFNDIGRDGSPFSPSPRKSGAMGRPAA